MLNRQIASVGIYRVCIPFRDSFTHAAQQRSWSDNVIVQLTLGTGITGFGETLPRPYVTGETVDSVVANIQRVFVPLLLNVRPDGFGQVFEVLERLPFQDDQRRPVMAARCAVELALLDVYGKYFDRDATALAGWLDQPRWGLPGSINSCRYSGVVGTDDPKRLGRKLRLMRWFGLRDYKIKLGDGQDRRRLEVVAGQLRRGLARRKYRLRVDVNGAWPVEQLEEKFALLREFSVPYVEQPSGKGTEGYWARLQTSLAIGIIPDESLITYEDGQRLAESKAVAAFNIRISKNGGLLPAMKLAALAQKFGLGVQLGCMVGETSILSAAGRWFLMTVRDVMFAEGSYGRFLLKDDITARPVGFGYGGRIGPLRGAGLGVRVDAEKLRKYCREAPIVINL